MYDIEAYYEANTVSEAIHLMEAHPQARLICGGTDVLIKVREGRMAGAELISIGEISALKGTEKKENGDIWVGAATTFSHITADPLIREAAPVLGEAVDQVGGPQIRNMGTIGGNICNGAVSADSVPALFSLECLLRLEGPEGSRISDMESFYLGPGKVALGPGELLTHVILPAERCQGSGGNYIKYAMRNAMDIATLSCCSVCRLDPEQRTLKDVRITFGVAAPVPYRAKKTEQALEGCAFGEETWELAARMVREEINPRNSWRASREFRLQIGGEIAARSLQAAAEQAKARLEGGR